MVPSGDRPLDGVLLSPRGLRGSPGLHPGHLSAEFEQLGLCLSVPPGCLSSAALTLPGMPLPPRPIPALLSRVLGMKCPPKHIPSLFCLWNSPGAWCHHTQTGGSGCPRLGTLAAQGEVAAGMVQESWGSVWPWGYSVSPSVRGVGRRSVHLHRFEVGTHDVNTWWGISTE